MAKKPEPAKPIAWDIYKAASKAKWIGIVVAADADDAVEKAAAWADSTTSMEPSWS